MGLVKKGDAAKEADKGKEDNEVPEDPPIVKQLKEIDDRYAAIEKEFNDACAKLQLEYTKLQQPILDERRKMLTDSACPTGKLSLPGFWLQALKHHPSLGDSVESWDEPVLEYVVDIEKVFLDETDINKGFKVVFKFAENPYFSNTVLEKEHIMGDVNPFNGERSCTSVKSTEIDWHAGKNVTVHLVTKKVKGGGAKKAKAKKPKEEPRESFFRDFFRTLYPGAPMFLEMKEAMFGHSHGDDDDDDDDSEDEDKEMLEYLLEEDLDKGNTLADFVIPYATRWYTGEVAPEGFGDDDDDDDDDEDEEEESEEESSAPPAKGKAKSKAKARGKKGSADSAGGDKKQEECKQQ